MQLPETQTASAKEATVIADDAATPWRWRTDDPETRRWWIKLIVQPALLLACGAILLAGLGAAQKLGWIGSVGSGHSHVSADEAATRYICPMMCTPPQTEPGRCPVCAMELVPATSSGAETDRRSVRIEPAARRVANIRTVPVQSMPMTRAIRAVGELQYDEGTLKTISAYVDGRLERLYADYTGVVVEQGDHLALVYSPQLYSGQVELLLARKARDESRSAALEGISRSNRDLYESTRQRLIELGMTGEQVDQLERRGEANSRMHLCAPISGTVIEKSVVEGQYVKEGQAIYKLADLSTVWLVLNLFPEDAAIIREGQQVAASVQSLPGREFAGRVAFIAPNVDPKTRTVGVRVVVPNRENVLRVGDYAKARIDVPLAVAAADRDGKNLESAPSAADNEALVVPRDAVLMAGGNSVLYVETEPGRFEIRRVVQGPICGDRIVILSGVSQGEQVATRGNFLIDSQMQLAGNPSLIDPTKAQPESNGSISAEVMAALSGLSPQDRALAERQRVCPVAGYPLGSMGRPPKVDVNGTPVFICCEGCRDSLLEEPDKYLKKLAIGDASDRSSESVPELDLPPIDVPELVEPQSGLPPMDGAMEIIGQPGINPQEPGRPAKRVSNHRREVVQ